MALLWIMPVDVAHSIMVVLHPHSLPFRGYRTVVLFQDHLLSNEASEHYHLIRRWFCVPSIYGVQGIGKDFREDG